MIKGESMDYISIGINLGIAIMVAIITSKLALKGFFRQEIWLRKEAKYSQIIDSLNKIQQFYWRMIDESSGEIDEAEDDLVRQKREEDFKNASREMELLATSPSFIISPKVHDIINDLVESSHTKTSEERMGNWFAYYDRLGYEAKEAKHKITEIAKKDLGIRIFRIGKSSRTKR